MARLRLRLRSGPVRLGFPNPEPRIPNPAYLYTVTLVNVAWVP